MSTAVLRVGCGKLPLETCLDGVPSVMIEASWHAGDADILGRIHATSGFNLLLSDGRYGAEMVQETVLAFTLVAARLTEVARMGATIELDFALFVDREKQSRSVALEPAFLLALSQAGINLKFTAYACSE